MKTFPARQKITGNAKVFQTYHFPFRNLFEFAKQKTLGIHAFLSEKLENL